MGMYLGVTAVRAHGEKLRVGFPKEKPRIAAGKRLIGIPNNGLWEIAPDLTCPGEYESLHGDYSRGSWLSCELYLLDESKVDLCPDEGRVRLSA